MGRTVIAELLARGLSVTVFGTGYEDDSRGVVTLISDLSDSLVIRSVAGQLDAVIHCDRSDRATTKSVSAALCKMLAAMPPHGRLISASGASCPDCPEAAETDRAVLSAAECRPQSAYVLAPALRSPDCLARTSVRTLTPSASKSDRVSRPLPTKTVEDCARLLACLAENGAFKGGAVSCPASAARVPADLVHPVRLGFGAPMSPEEFGFRASPAPRKRSYEPSAVADRMSARRPFIQ
ncbi:NAD(P)-dependent oxidoreductase [Roseivivax sediminis]|nr:hypothetical protein [Roseivivax sediminis]